MFGLVLVAGVENLRAGATGRGLLKCVCQAITAMFVAKIQLDHTRGLFHVSISDDIRVDMARGKFPFVYPFCYRDSLELD